MFDNCFINERSIQALYNFGEYREIHIRTPRSNTSDFMGIRIGFAEENDPRKILFEISFERWNSDTKDNFIKIAGKAR